MVVVVVAVEEEEDEEGKEEEEEEAGFDAFSFKSSLSLIDEEAVELPPCVIAIPGGQEEEGPTTLRCAVDRGDVCCCCCC